MRLACCVVAAVSAVLGGCASYAPLAAPEASMARSGVIDDPNQAKRLERVLTDQDIALLLDADIKAKLPSALAVAKITSQCAGYQPFLETIDAEELQGWANAAGKHPSILGIHPVSPLVHSQDRATLHSLRQAAARMSCELLLVYLQADSSVNNYNDAAVLYWTVVGLWLVPGSTYEHQTVMQAILVDCRTGMILGTATGDCHLKRHYAAAYKDIATDQLSRDAPVQALKDLQTGFVNTIDGVVRTATAKGNQQRRPAPESRQAGPPRGGSPMTADTATGDSP
ncbi:MAG TPA: hypothetical protein VNA25_14510 [Phycisphaerae bacterium]|nr:hypothetical protein [Phycisphaerae bacterium]